MNNCLFTYREIQKKEKRRREISHGLFGTKQANGQLYRKSRKTNQNRQFLLPTPNLKMGRMGNRTEVGPGKAKVHVIGEKG